MCSRPTHHVTSSPGKHVTLLQHHLQPPTQGQHNNHGLDVHLVRPGLVSWSCDQCTLDNPATVAVCAACGVPRPRLKRGAGWACQVRRQTQTLWQLNDILKVCTLQNKSSATVCKACETPRPEVDPRRKSESLTPSKAGHWICHMCTFENSPKRAACQVSPCGVNQCSG